MPGIYDHASDRTPAELAGLLNDSFGAIQAAPLYKGIDPTKSPGVAPAGSMLAASPSMGTSLMSHPVTTLKVDGSNWDNPTRAPAQAPVNISVPYSAPAQSVKYSMSDLTGTSLSSRPPSTQLPPALYGNTLGYVSEDKNVARNRDANGNYSAPLSAIDAVTTLSPSSGPHSLLGQVVAMMGAKPKTPAANMAGAPKINTGDAWTGLRFGEPVAQRRGMVTGTPQGIMAPAVASQPTQTLGVPTAARPIEFAPGSPNASFEHDHGMGSATNSMVNSERWNTGYGKP